MAASNRFKRNKYIPNPIARPQKSTTYTVIVSNGGCSDTESVTVHIIPSSKIPPLDITICKGESRTLNVSGGIKYKWLPAEGLSSDTIANSVATPQNSTTYKAVIYKQKCADTATFNIIVNQPSEVKIEADSTACPGDLVEISVSGADTYF